MPVHICVRQTLDWRDETLVKARILPDFRKKFDCWNQTFDMPYWTFRQHVKEIAALNLKEVEEAHCTPIDEVPPEAIIVPVDDDDWFAPDLALRLKNEPDRDCYLWKRAAIEKTHPVRGAVRAIARLFGRRDEYVCKTNNYAVKNTPRLARLALSHVRASHYFEAHPGEVRVIEATLAVQNRHLGSQTSLAWKRPTIGRAELVTLLEEHQQLYAAHARAPELGWTKPYVQRMADLLATIHVK